ncbi:hypothetical protein B1T45_02480 [Mycobacterium kansasii]|uniref:Methyltransferase n=2 Tax=Mycobacterium kansasii TaxID=1768 RepID=A0A1V3WDH6_MYCKA|nr:hypothetical protein [Mycobacterium kansasii]AGZ54501.1 hypothetical protein MKAN_26700 [Mycobacterium kansasii ATCC 12478]ETZ99942.1 hypothetical protein I547_5015 [Mycobacterium kansasii 824]ARG54909.1 hypothetical protein B1T43_02425 [Mycobacterium kansasii]ARG60367.1 hypothetical protein B1T45_02480 [Mycobacterium kansasii]ARG68040.1 hypothetical protein B1T47_02200 [Mycobacterium kansasii]
MDSVAETSSLLQGTPQELWWGREDFISELVNDHVCDIRVQRGSLRADRFDHPYRCPEYFQEYYGPAINAYPNIGADTERVAELDSELSCEYFTDGVMECEYLILTARKR